MNDPRDWGSWVCEACGMETMGERGEPPLDHVHHCDDATGESLKFTAGIDRGTEGDDGR